MDIKIENIKTIDIVFTITNLIDNYGYKRRIDIYLCTDATNCKLSYIHNAGDLFVIKDKEKKQIINEVLKKAKGAVILNTTNREVFNFIKNNYQVYYAYEVPIGYARGYQFHICFRNNINTNPSCRIPIVNDDELNKITIKNKLLKVLKDKKRKNDYVDEFINSL